MGEGEGGAGGGGPRAGGCRRGQRAARGGRRPGVPPRPLTAALRPQVDAAYGDNGPEPGRCRGERRGGSRSRSSERRSLSPQRSSWTARGRAASCPAPTASAPPAPPPCPTPVRGRGRRAGRSRGSRRDARGPRGGPGPALSRGSLRRRRGQRLHPGALQGVLQGPAPPGAHAGGAEEARCHQGTSEAPRCSFCAFSLLSCAGSAPLHCVWAGSRFWLRWELGCGSVPQTSVEPLPRVALRVPELWLCPL